MLPTTELAVKGMTCNHCKMAVTNAVSGVPGVTGVDVDLDTGRVSVTHDKQEIALDEVKRVIKEAGYEVD